MRITISTTLQRKQPRTGDLRTTKKHGLQIRIPVRVTWGPHKGAFVVSRGRQCYEWVSPAEACAQGYRHCVPEAHRPPVNPYPAGYMQQRGAA